MCEKVNKFRDSLGSSWTVEIKEKLMCVSLTSFQLYIVPNYRTKNLTFFCKGCTILVGRTVAFRQSYVHLHADVCRMSRERKSRVFSFAKDMCCVYTISGLAKVLQTLLCV